MTNSEKIIRDFIQKQKIKSGDVIVTKLFKTGQSSHFILFLDDINFIQNTKIGNVAKVSVEELAYEISNNFKRIDRFVGDNLQRLTVRMRALDIERSGRKYNIITYNCEHFIEEARTGRVHSKQVDNAAALVGTSGIGLAVYGSVKNKPGALFLGLGLAFFAAAAYDSNNNQFTYSH